MDHDNRARAGVAATPVPEIIMTATRRAAHRRDHDHSHDSACCAPHTVEVIDLGTHAFSICHDCGEETPTTTHDQAVFDAEAHRRSCH